jgi:hypothetical protein
LEKWAAELSQHSIEFEKRTSIKSQVLVYFLANWNPSQNPTEEKKQLTRLYIVMEHGASQGLVQQQ